MKEYQPQSEREFAKTVSEAVKLSQRMGHEFVTLEHLLKAALDHPAVIDIVKQFSADREAISAELDAYLSSGAIDVVEDPRGELDPLLREMTAKTIGVSAASNAGVAFVPHILKYLAEMPSDSCKAALLIAQHGIKAEGIKRYLQTGLVERPKAHGLAGFGDSDKVNTKFKTADEAREFLLNYAQDLNEQSKSQTIDPLIGRAEEVGDLIRVLAHRRKNNPILIGEAGVGKTAIAEGLASKIVAKEVPKVLEEAVIYSLDLTALIAGTKYRGEFEERMLGVINAGEMIPHAIIFIDEIHNLMGSGAVGGGSMDGSNMLKPALARGKFRCIGSTTHDEYRKHIEKDKAIIRRFKTIAVEEPSAADAKAILRGLKESYEKHHNVSFTDEAIDAAVDLAVRYISKGMLPDKAIDVLDGAGARRRTSDDSENTVIGVQDIEVEIARIARIPEMNVKEDDAAKIGGLGDDLRKAVFGQDKAISTLRRAIMISRAGLAAPNKPQGSFLFTGPTGVGKTEVCKQLAKTLGVHFERFDMSEYMEQHSVSRLIGAPPGYVGFDQGGLLTNAVDKHPYCVILLDEIEKAHRSIYNVLLQVMDDGSLTDATGKRVDFRNVILIMTSNVGAAAAEKPGIGFNPAPPSVDPEAIKKAFTPEFRNRLDAIVQFDHLERAQVLSIVSKFIDELRTLADPRGVKIEISEDAMAFLADKGFDRNMGGRPLARVITERVKEPLAEMILLGDLRKGGTAKIDAKDGEIVIAAA